MAQVRKISRSRLCPGLLAALLMAAPAIAIAQTAGPLPPAKMAADPALANAIRLDVSMVLVNVAVTDLQDHPVTGLAKDDFQIYENGVEQEVVTFSHEDAPVSVGLLFDMSGSMANKIDKAVAAASQILKTANPNDEFFLVTFGNRPMLIRQFTSDVNDLRDRLTAAVPKGQTALFDAIQMGIEQMKSARNSKRALVIISDGGDNHSRNDEKRVRSALREADCQVYAMGVFDNPALLRTREERKGPELLSEFADLTGGQAYTVSNAADLSDLAGKISLELRDRYVLGYRPDSDRDGAWRAIKVKVAQPEGTPPLRILSKTGYYSPRD